MEIEKVLLRKVGEAVHRFKMIRDGDRVAVALSGGKDSMTLLEALLLLAKRAPVDFTVCAFTVEQGKFLRPIEPLGAWLKGDFHAQARKVLLQPGSACRRTFAAPALESALDPRAVHRGGSRAGEKIWILLSFEYWHQTYIDNAYGKF